MSPIIFTWFGISFLVIGIGLGMIGMTYKRGSWPSLICFGAASLLCFAAAVCGFLAIATQAARAEIRVVDGDTIVHDGERVRIWGLDCPELRVPGGPEAKRALRNLLTLKPVTVERVGYKSYGRTVGIVRARNRDVAKRMIASKICKEWCYYSKGAYGTCWR